MISPKDIILIEGFQCLILQELKDLDCFKTYIRIMYPKSNNEIFCNIQLFEFLNLKTKMKNIVIVHNNHMTLSKALLNWKRFSHNEDCYNDCPESIIDRHFESFDWDYIFQRGLFDGRGYSSEFWMKHKNVFDIYRRKYSK